jgi:magnesium transporter
LALAFVADHPDDAARLLERVASGDAAAILAGVPAAVAAEVYRALAPSPAASCAAALGDDALAAILAALPLDAARATLRRVDPARREVLLARLETERRDRLRAALAYAEDAAGALADPLVLALPDDMTVADAQRQLRGSGRHLLSEVYVVARDRTLVGTVTLPDLIKARPRDTLAAVMDRAVARLEAHVDLVTIAAHPAWLDRDALPVVNPDGTLIGAIRHTAIRRRGAESAPPMMTTLVGLSELYWAGLTGILASLAPARPRAEEDDDGS